MVLKFLLILAGLHMYAIDGNTFIFHKQESPACFHFISNGSDNTLEGFEKAEGESRDLPAALCASISDAAAPSRSR